MTRSLVHSFGSQINGNAIFFYLKPRKDFTFHTDFKAVQDFLHAWNEADGNCSNNVLKRLAQTFHDSLKKYEDELRTEDKIEDISIAVFPALDDKPFIIKHPLRDVPPEEPWDPPLHTLASDALLGGSNRETLYVNRSPKRGILQNTLRIYITSFLVDKCPINESTRAATHRTAVHPWAGNILVLKEKSGRSELCEDITDEDVEIAIEYFSLYRRL